MVKEKFTFTLTIPTYLINKIEEKRKDLKRSEYIEETVNKNLNKVEELLKEKQTKDISVSMDISTIDKIKQLAAKYNTTEGRIVYLSLLLEALCDE